MTNHLLKTNIPGYYKDEKTGAILNNNDDEYHRFLSQKQQYKEYLKTKEEIASLRSEMAEIKRLFLEKINNG